LHSAWESVGHGPVQISSVPLTWETRFERSICRRTSASTSNRAAGLSRSHGLLRSVPVRRYRVSGGGDRPWYPTLCYELLPRRDRNHRWEQLTGPPLEASRSNQDDIWHALYRSIRSRGPRDKAGSSNDRAVPDSARASVGRYELLRTTEGQGCHQGLSLQSLSGSFGTGCDTMPSSVLPGTNSHWWRQGSSLHSIVKRRIQLRSFGSFARRLGTLLTTLSATKTLVRGSEAYTSKQCGRCGTLLYRRRLGAVLYFVVDNRPSSLIVTYRLLATFFSASLTSDCLHIRSRSPGQYESTHL